MISHISPPFLSIGDKVGIVAPASAIKYKDLLDGIDVLKNDWRLEVIEGNTLKSNYYQFSATDQHRKDDLQKFLDDDSIKAIFAARGGYGCSRILDDLDFSNFIKRPKWLIGFSDLTALTSHVFNLGIQSIHGPMVKSMTLDGAGLAVNYLKQILFGQKPSYHVPSSTANRNGTVNAAIVGGNICLLAHLIGSKSDVNTEGKILFIEDINEYYYNLDRMMVQLNRAGKLEHLAGLIVGQFTDMKDDVDIPFGKSVDEIIYEHVEKYDFPVCFNFPVGHVAHNLPIIIGSKVDFSVQPDGVTLKF